MRARFCIKWCVASLVTSTNNKKQGWRGLLMTLLQPHEWMFLGHGSPHSVAVLGRSCISCHTWQFVAELALRVPSHLKTWPWRPGSSDLQAQTTHLCTQSKPTNLRSAFVLALNHMLASHVYMSRHPNKGHMPECILPTRPDPSNSIGNEWPHVCDRSHLPG